MKKKKVNHLKTIHGIQMSFGKKKSFDSKLKMNGLLEEKIYMEANDSM